MQTYLFYDIETTGLSKSFDQVLHFAAIRTDLALQEIERYELVLKFNPDIVPSPLAMITHHMSIEEILAGTSEIDAIKQIHHWMNEPETISVGYNSLEFDDEFLRFSFYRNLLPPYTHQFANQCGRMDIYPMAIMYFLYKNNVIKWPRVDSKNSLKLEDINQINQLATGRAHHAMVDVEATLTLAQRFFAERKMWDYVTGYFNKKTDQERTQETFPEGLMVYGKIGAANYYQCPVLFLGNHNHYKNQTRWLRLDTPELATTTEETIATTTKSFNKKWGEPGFILPNKERFLQHLSSERQAIAETNRQWLKQNPELFKKITEYHCNYTYPSFPNTDIDAGLYLNGFWSDADNGFCRRFHAVHPEEKSAMIEKATNVKLKALAIRVLGRHYPDALKENQAEQFNEYMQRVNPNGETDVIIDYKGNKRLDSKAALHEIKELRKKTLTPEQTALLAELESYLSTRFSVS